MKKRILGMISLILCVASFMACIGCNSESVIDESDTFSDTLESVIDSESDTASEKKTNKKTDKKTEASKSTTDSSSETKLIPGVSKAEFDLTSKTYNFANMSTIEQTCFKLLGRAKVSKEGLNFDTSCATLEFQGYMSGDVVIEINSKLSGYDYGQSYFTVYVDGKRSGTRFEVESGSTKKLTIASFTGDYFHTIKIVKQTEYKWSLATIKSLKIKGYIIEAPAEKDYYIEFLGDSLTSAYGNIGKPGDTPDDSPKFQDGTKSFAYLFAEALDADYAMISRSSGGINQCWSNTPMIDNYKKFSILRNDDLFDISNARKPDLIVIHLGANDYNFANHKDSDGGTEFLDSERAAFVNGGKTLINYFRNNYGNDVPIIWAYDPREGLPDEVEEIIDSFGGASKGYYVLALPWSEAGAGGHPSAAEHEKQADILLNFVVKNNILK